MNTITHFRAGYIIRRTSTFSHSIVSFHASSEKNNRPSSSLPRDPISWMPQRWPFSFLSFLVVHRSSAISLRVAREIEYERISSHPRALLVRLRFTSRVNNLRELQLQFVSRDFEDLFSKFESKTAPRRRVRILCIITCIFC